jgi:hypothetical protein
MSKELIPELHDCLKLTTLQHNFSDFDKFLKFTPDTRSWAGVLQHHCKKAKADEESFPAFPTDKETFLLHMADGIASNFSRHRQSYKGENAFIIYKLWNPQGFKEDLRLKTDDEIIGLLKLYSTDPTFEELVRRYGKILESRSEDAHLGKNITSLLTHLTLTGKFYRFLKNSRVLNLSNKEIIPDLEKVSALTKTKSEQWQIYLMLCRLNFNQQPFRARDLNIFELLEETINNIIKKFPDNILFANSDELLIFYDESSVFDQIKDEVFKNGFWLSAVWVKKALAEIKKADPGSLAGNKNENIFATTIPDKIEPPLCEICQAAYGENIWPEEYLSKFGLDEDIAQEGIEHLCNTCFSIRSRPSRLKKLKYWTEENSNVIWLKIRLNYEKLMLTLEQLYFEYLQRLNPNVTKEEAEVRFSLVYEFQRDYNDFLKRFKDGIIKIFSHAYIETVLDGMFCIKAKNKTDTFLILELINNLLKSVFPEFLKKLDNPIKVSISFCASKHPFFEVWRDIKEQSSDVQINLVGKGIIKTTYKYIDEILIARNENYRRSSLHNLAEIARISEKLAEIKFNDRTERSDFYSYEALRRHLLPIGMDFKGILTFVKLLEG